MPATYMYWDIVWFKTSARLKWTTKTAEANNVFLLADFVNCTIAFFFLGPQFMIHKAEKFMRSEKLSPNKVGLIGQRFMLSRSFVLFWIKKIWINTFYLNYSWNIYIMNLVDSKSLVSSSFLKTCWKNCWAFVILFKRWDFNQEMPSNIGTAIVCQFI